MVFNQHSSLEGLHAFLGASKPYWLNYSDDKIVQSYINALAKERGTRLHEFAAEAIRLKQPLKGKTTIARYVNDAIGFGMQPEVILYYSDVFFGTADSIRFDEKKSFLRIHDLKTGVTEPHKEQLEVYAALFCLEYHVKPMDIQIELRIYQNDDFTAWNPGVEDIVPIMDKGIAATKLIHSQNLTGVY